MLPAQVSYWTLIETQRHNLATEALGFDTLKETQRHNVVGETETGRHNRQQEALGWSTLGETSRHNIAQEDIGYGNIGLGYANLNESIRHNLVYEDIQAYSAEASMRAADARMQQALVSERQRQDTWRKYVYYEYPLAQRNIAISQQRADTEQYRADTERWYRAADVLQHSGFKITNPANGNWDSVYDANWQYVPNGWNVYTNPILPIPSGTTTTPLLPGG